MLMFMMHQKSRGTVELQNKDIFNPPSITQDLFEHEQDIETLAMGE